MELTKKLELTKLTSDIWNEASMIKSFGLLNALSYSFTTYKIRAFGSNNQKLQILLSAMMKEDNMATWISHTL